MLAEVYPGRCKGKEREREGRREGITGVERRENCRTGLQFCHCPVVHASSVHMATSMPAELHGLVIQALLCLNRLSSGSFEHDGNAQASSLDGRSNGAPCAWPDLPPPPPQGLLLLRQDMLRLLGIQLRARLCTGVSSAFAAGNTEGGYGAPSAPCSGPSDCRGKMDMQKMEKGEVYKQMLCHFSCHSLKLLPHP